MVEEEGGWVGRRRKRGICRRHMHKTTKRKKKLTREIECWGRKPGWN
jgi:hypothetical protein